jgi:hypothetical protein
MFYEKVLLSRKQRMNATFYAISNGENHQIYKLRLTQKSHKITSRFDRNDVACRHATSCVYAYQVV